MKQSEIEIAMVIVVIGMFLSLAFFDEMIIGIAKVLYAELSPFNIVFSPDIDLSKIDASQILNCLHSSGDSGGCPEGVSYVNDDTGEIEERKVIPNQQQPVEDFSPEALGITIPIIDDTSGLPTEVVDKVNTSYIVYVLIIIGLAGVLIFLLHRWKNRKNTISA